MLVAATLFLTTMRSEPVGRRLRSLADLNPPQTIDPHMNVTRLFRTLALASTLLVGSHTAVAQADPFIGQIAIVPYNFAPIGWTFCAGQLLPISQNTALFSLLGTNYGGNGLNTFGLPDLRGRFPLGAGSGPGLTPRLLGEMGGAEAYTMTIAQLPAHAHPLMAQSAEATLSSPNNALLAAKARVPLYAPGGPNVFMGAGSIGSTGGNQPYQVMPPYTTVNYIIALEGIYPSRS
jgi:microcystin-dependent protein